MAKKKLDFEGAMVRLDEIVNLLERGDAPLEQAMALFEEGAKLLRECTAQLDAAAEFPNRQGSDLDRRQRLVQHPQRRRQIFPAAEMALPAEENLRPQDHRAEIFRGGIRSETGSLEPQRDKAGSLCPLPDASGFSGRKTRLEFLTDKESQWQGIIRTTR